MFASQVLRRRSVLAIFFSCSLLYFISSVFRQNVILENSEVREPISLDSIIWEIDLESRSNRTFRKSCRNSIQGKELIVDERGFVCKRAASSSNGCCVRGADGTRRFVCDSCQINGCCSVYEFCVSCCLQPQKRSVVRKSFVRASRTFHYLFSTVKDIFDVCLAKCRTSSQSVQHENTYRNPNAKFCYGDDLPAVQMS